MVNIITGEIQSGKTTYLLNLIKDSFSGKTIAGYTTKRILDNTNTIIGFSFKTFTTNREILFAHSQQKIGNKKFGNYFVNENSFVKLIDEIKKVFEPDLLVFDELGKMEINNDYFVNQIKLFVRNYPLSFIVIQKRVLDFWLEKLEIEAYNLKIIEKIS